MKNTNISALFLSMSLLVGLPAFADSAKPEIAAPVILSQLPTSPSAPTKLVVEDDASRYAQRETLAKTQANYQGGDALIVGVTATSTALLVLILLLILL